MPIDDDGVYQIAFQAIDSRGDVAVAYATLTVTDSRGFTSLPGEVFEVFAGTPVTVPVRYADDGNDPITRMTVTFEDGSSQTIVPLTVSGNVADQVQTFEFIHAFGSAGFFDLPVDYTTDEGTFSDLIGVTALPPAPTIGQELVTIAEGDDLTFTPSTIGADGVLIEFGGEDLRSGGSADVTAVPNQPITITWADLNALGITDDGSYTFQLFSDARSTFGEIAPRPFESDPDSSVTTITLVVQNAAPEGQLLGDSVLEGQDATVRFIGVTDPSPDDRAGQFTLMLDIGGDGTFEQTQTINGTGNASFTVPASSLNNGALAIPVFGMIVDEDGGTTDLFAQVNVTDVVPTLELVGADSINEGSSYSLTLAATDLDLGGSPAQWVVNWGDNTTSVLNAASGTLEHIYEDNDADGLATIVATLVDNDGTYTASKTIIVNDVAPTLGISTDVSVADEGTLLVFDLSVFDPGDDALQSWLINWGDGSTPQQFGGDATAVRHVYADNGTFTITATATDEEGTHSATPLNVTLNNIAPEVRFTTEQGNAPIVEEGSELVLVIGEIIDPGVDFASSLIIDWGDSTSTTVNVPVDPITSESEANDDGVVGASQDDLDVADDLRGSFTLDNTFNGEGQRYQASVNGTIGTGVDEDFFRVDVSAGDALNIVVGGGLTTPIIRLLTPGDTATPTQLAFEGGSGTLSFADFAEDAAVYVMVESQGAETGGYTLDVEHIRKSSLAIDPIFVTHRYDDGDATRTISVRIVDEDGTHTASTTLDVTVLNIAPTVQIAGLAEVNAGETYTLQLSDLTDPGNDTVSGYLIDWGDGFVEPVGIVTEATHEYTTPGIYTILVSVIDEDGTSIPGAGAYRLDITLNDADATDLLLAEDEPNDDGVDGISVADLQVADDLDPNFVPIGGRDFEATFTGEIDSLTDFGDFFQISARDGESIQIQLVGGNADDGALIDPKVALVDPSGTILSSNDDIDAGNPNAALTFDFTADGLYYIVADTELIPDALGSSTMVRGTGTYDLIATINRPMAVDLLTSEVEANDDGMADDIANDLPFANDLSGSFVPLSGTTKTASLSGRIAAGLDRDPDVFRINASPGDVLTIAMSSDRTVGNPLGDPIVRLLDRNGLELEVNDNSGDVNNAFLVFSNFIYDGIYYIIAKSNELFGVQEVTVNEVSAPSIAISGAPTANEQSPYTLTLGQLSGPGSDQVEAIIVDWGDSTIIEYDSLGDVLITYEDDFAYTISVDLQTTDGTVFENVAQQRVVVEGVAPIVQLDPVVAIDEGGTASLSGTFSDVGLLDTFTLVVDWGDSTSPSNIQTLTFDSSAAAGQPFTLTHPYLDDGPTGSFVVTVTVTDDDGAIGSASETVQVSNIDPTITEFNVPSTVQTNTEATLTASATDPAGPADPLTYTWTIRATSGPNIGDVTERTGTEVSFTPTAAGQYEVTLVVSDDDGGSATETTTLVVSDQVVTLQVAEVEPTTAGLIVRFSEALDTSTLNLFGVDPADLTLVGPSGAVTGSLVTDQPPGEIRFVATNSVLEPGNYTLTLRSGADAFQSASGALLDGDGDGSAGDDFTATFIVDPFNGVTLNLPDFARGAGQSVDLPVGTPGIPLTIDNALGVDRVRFALTFDSTLLSVNGASVGADAPAGTIVSFNDVSSSQVQVEISVPGGLPDGVLELVRLDASVPDSAPLTLKHVLEISDLTVELGGVDQTARDRDGLHVAAYLGDAFVTDASYSTEDVAALQRAALGLGSTGFNDYPNADRLLIGDVNNNETIDLDDAIAVLSATFGIPTASLPQRTVADPAIPTGLDPLLAVGRVEAETGGQTIVPLTLHNTDVIDVGVHSFRSVIEYDPTQVQIIDVHVGDLGALYGVAWHADASRGLLIVAGHRLDPLMLSPGEGGTLVDIDVALSNELTIGETVILNQLSDTGSPMGTLSTGLNGNTLVLIPAPTNAPDDPVDGHIVIVDELAENLADGTRANPADDAPSARRISFEAISQPQPSQFNDILIRLLNLFGFGQSKKTIVATERTDESLTDNDRIDLN